MTYSLDYRIGVLSFIKDGGSKTEAERIFKVSRDTIYRWLNSSDLSIKTNLSRHRNIDKEALKQHVNDYPDALLRERAVFFKVHESSISRALFKMNIRKKKSVVT